MKLYIIHMRFTRRRLLLTAAALVLVTGMTLLLAGCFRSSTPCEEVELATNDQRVAYLQGLGWQVGSEVPVGRLSEAAGEAGPALRRLRRADRPPLHLHRHQLPGGA